MCTNSYNVPHVHMHLRCQQNALLPYLTVPRDAPPKRRWDDEEEKHPLELMVVPIYVLVPILQKMAHWRTDHLMVKKECSSNE